MNVNGASAVNFVQRWGFFGFHCYLGACAEDVQCHRVALLSRLPLRAIDLQTDVQASHCLGCVAEVLHQGHTQKLLVLSCCGRASDVSLARQFVAGIVQCVNTYDLPWLLTGGPPTCFGSRRVDFALGKQLSLAA